MRYLRFMAAVLVVVLPMLVYLFWPGDESRIRKAVNGAIEAVEAGDPSGVMSAVSLNYHDDRGLSYLYIRKIIEREMKGLGDIEVQMVSFEVRVIGEKAFVTLEVRLIATGPDGVRGYWLGDMDSPFFMELQMRNEKPRGWKVISSKSGNASAALQSGRNTSAL